MKQIKIIDSRNIHDYKLILNGLFEEEGFGHPFLETVMVWCNIIEESQGGLYWQVWLIKYKDKNIGICGLYSHKKNSVKELWLGWFGIHPNYRDKKIGSHVLNWMEQHAKKIGCKTILSYVDKVGRPLSFYYRNGYKRKCSVKSYLKSKPNIGRENFEHLNDHIIFKHLC
jgi:GNAT superfamily N-acetyltransferase